MRTYLTGQASCRGMLVHYYLLEEDLGQERSYGILVECGADRMELRSLTPAAERARGLLEAMCRGAVTPVTARDVVKDWLLE